MMIELGGGTKPHPRANWVIDTHHPGNAPAQDATVVPWQSDGTGAIRREVGLHPGLIGGPTRTIYTLADEVADEVYASHFIEHIPKGGALLTVMNEAWRVLKPGGAFTIIVPLVGHTDSFGQSRVVNRPEAWADPTHVSHWWFPESLHYFTGESDEEADYGVHAWKPLGKLVSEQVANDVLLTEHTYEPSSATASFWCVRGSGGWEGVARLVKPC